VSPAANDCPIVKYDTTEGAIAACSDGVCMSEADLSGWADMRDSVMTADSDNNLSFDGQQSGW